MDSRDDTRPPPAGSAFYEASFIQSATSPLSVLMVRIDAFGDMPFGDPEGVVWSPLGGALPAAGDRCLVAESDDGAWWVLAWWSGAQAAAMPTANARVFNSGNLSIPDNTLTALTFDSERFDNGGLHSTSVNTSRLTAPSTGIYVIGGHLRLVASAAGIRQATIRANGATDIASVTDPTPGVGAATDFSLSALYQLAAGQYVELEAYQNSGGALNVSAVPALSPEFWMSRIA